MGMQETAKIALAHSASCRLAIDDNMALSAARQRARNALEELSLAKRDVEAGRLADGGRFSTSSRDDERPPS